MRDELKWYSRFADIPGIQYVPLITVNKKKLWGQGKRPKIKHYDFDSKQHTSVMWLTPDGSYTSASPAKQHTYGYMESDPNPNVTLILLSEGLELSGTASDYHFMLQDAHESLWRHRREQPFLYNTIERICQMDIALIMLLGQDMYGELPFAVSAFGCLASMYEVEGRLNEALSIYEQAESQKHFVRNNRKDHLRAVLGADS